MHFYNNGIMSIVMEKIVFSLIEMPGSVRVCHEVCIDKLLQFVGLRVVDCSSAVSGILHRLQNCALAQTSGFNPSPRNPRRGQTCAPLQKRFWFAPLRHPLEVRVNNEANLLWLFTPSQSVSKLCRGLAGSSGVVFMSCDTRYQHD